MAVQLVKIQLWRLYNNKITTHILIVPSYLENLNRNVWLKLKLWTCGEVDLFTQNK